MTRKPIQEIYIPYFFQLFFKLGKRVKEISSEIKTTREENNKFHYIKAETELFKEIKSFLENNIDYPIVSKQTFNDIDKNSLTKFWLINILNNYDLFMNKRDSLSIEIALIDNQKSVAGFIFYPYLDELYFGMENFGAYKVSDFSKKALASVEKNFKEITENLPLFNNQDILVLDEDKKDSLFFVKSLMQECSFSGEIHLSGSKKYIAVVEGSGGVFLNVEPSLEWETAASHALLKALNKNIVIEETKEELLYNKTPYINPPILVM